MSFKPNRVSVGRSSMLTLFLNIKGFTFFKDGYISNYRNKIGGKETSEENSSQAVLSYMDKYKIHDQEKQWNFFKMFIQHNTIKSKLKMDKALTDIMNLSSYN